MVFRVHELLKTKPNFSTKGLSSWQPPLSGVMDLHIAKDGTWYHEEKKIQRTALIRLFSRILRCEADGHYYLLTPVEKWRISVEDLPFRAIDCRHHKGTWIFSTDVDDEISLDDAHPLLLCDDNVPSIVVRDNLQARLTRNLYYWLVERGTLEYHKGCEILALKSGDSVFSLGETKAISSTNDTI